MVLITRITMRDGLRICNIPLDTDLKINPTNRVIMKLMALIILFIETVFKTT